jgi:hypothetical protein
MVLIWNELAAGDAELCAVMVAFNSVLQIVLYAPLSLLYLQVRIHPTSTYLLPGGWVKISLKMYAWGYCSTIQQYANSPEQMQSHAPVACIWGLVGIWAKSLQCWTSVGATRSKLPCTTPHLCSGCRWLLALLTRSKLAFGQWQRVCCCSSASLCWQVSK